MKTNAVITIGRQFGSGGREVGIKLAAKLGIPYYDKALLRRAAKESGLQESIFQTFDEKPKNLFYLFSAEPGAMHMGELPYDVMLEEQVFTAAGEVIKKCAQEGPCVIIGRCADYILRKNPALLSLFIYAPLEERAERIVTMKGVNLETAKNMIHKEDRHRASYYNYYTSKKWGDIRSYHFCIDSSQLGIDGTVTLIEQIVTMRDQMVQNEDR